MSELNVKDIRDEYFIIIVADLQWRVGLAYEGREIVGPLLSKQDGRAKGQNDIEWNERISLSIRTLFTDPTTCIVLSLYHEENLIASSTLYLYEEGSDGKILLRQGRQKVRLWLGKHPCVTADATECTTESTPQYNQNTLPPSLSKICHFDGIKKLYDDGLIDYYKDHDDQDNVTLDNIEDIQREEAFHSKRLYLFIRLPFFSPTVYYQPSPSINNDSSLNMWENVASTMTQSSRNNSLMGTAEADQIWIECTKDTGQNPRSLVPTSAAYKCLQKLIEMPLCWKWSPDKRALLWKYRYWLKEDEKAMPKFVQNVDWYDREEVNLSREILLTWKRPSVWTLLELMTVDGPYLSEDVDLLWLAAFSRSFYEIQYEALDLLLPCILSYFERISLIQDFYPTFDQESDKSTDSMQGEGDNTAVHKLAELLALKATEWPSFGQALFWHLKVRSKEIKDELSSNPTSSVTSNNVYAQFLGLLFHHLQRSEESKAVLYSLFKQEKIFNKMIALFQDCALDKMSRPERIEWLKEVISEPNNGVLSFTPVSLPYDAAIQVTGTLPDRLLVFKSNAMPVKVSFVTTDITEHACIVKVGEDLRQDVFVLGVLKFVDMIWKGEGLDLLLTPYRCVALTLTDGMLEFIPSEPLSNIITAYNGDLKAYLSASLLSNTADLESLMAILDLSDINLMAQKTEGLRAKSSGREVPEVVMDTFIKSCAGYCVFTYVMGIGDRHLDNLLLTTEGRLFHVDFSYLFGEDPRPFPPPMKLCKEMVEAMDGPNGRNFRKFKSICFQAFKLLRKHSRYLIAYLELQSASMGGGDVPRGDPGGKHTGVMRGGIGPRYVMGKLMLDMEEMDALVALERLIDDSMNALFPKVFETLHKWAQYWRK